MHGGDLMGASVKIESTSRTKEYELRMKAIEKKAVKAGAEILAETIRKEVPVSNIDHLHIRDDIVIAMKNEDGATVAHVGPSKRTAWRAKFLEFGTVKMSPNPFMSRSEKLSRERVLEAIKREVQKGLNL
jgi:HK97 gp10 family phage protein